MKIKHRLVQTQHDKPTIRHGKKTHKATIDLFKLQRFCLKLNMGFVANIVPMKWHGQNLPCG